MAAMLRRKSDDPFIAEIGDLTYKEGVNMLLDELAYFLAFVIDCKRKTINLFVGRKGERFVGNFEGHINLLNEFEKGKNLELISVLRKIIFDLSELLKYDEKRITPSDFSPLESSAKTAAALTLDLYKKIN